MWRDESALGSPCRLFRSVDQELQLSREQAVANNPTGVGLIHQMDNLTNRPTVEIHVYGQDLSGFQRCLFDAETGRVIAYGSRKYDNE